MSTQLNIVYKPLAELVRRQWPGNPRQHSNSVIRASIVNNGFRVPLVWDPGTERVVAGHGRLAELDLLRSQGAAPPLHVHVTPEDWHVPCVVGVPFDSELEAEAFLLADNHSTDAADYLDNLLAAALARQLEADNLNATGFDFETAEALIAYAEVAATPTKWTDSERGLLRDERLEIYKNATIKQIVVYLEGPQYEWALTVLERLRLEYELKTNTEAVIFLLQHHADRPCPSVGDAA